MVPCFDTSGPCIPGAHHMLPPARRLEHALALIEGRRFFTLHGGGVLRVRGRMDPAEFTFESLAADQRRRGGPAWRAAVDAGIDVTLIERNLALTPNERLAQLDAMLQLIHEAHR